MDYLTASNHTISTLETQDSHLVKMTDWSRIYGASNVSIKAGLAKDVVRKDKLGNSIMLKGSEGTSALWQQSFIITLQSYNTKGYMKLKLS